MNQDAVLFSLTSLTDWWSFCSKMLNLCGETEEKLAQELLVFELQIERDVVEPLYVLAEVSIFLFPFNVMLKSTSCVLFQGLTKCLTT